MRMEKINLRNQRLAKGLTLEEMARSCEMSVSCLSRMESRGAIPRPRKLRAISLAYGLSTEQLIAAIVAINAILPNPPEGLPSSDESCLRNDGVRAT